MRPPFPFIVALIAVLFCGSSALGDEPVRGETSFFNDQWLDTVVSIEVEEIENGKTKLSPIGTGFLVETEKGHVLLVTAKHVIVEKAGAVKPNLRYRLNESSGGSVLLQNEEVERHNAGQWYFSSDYDVACRFIAWTGKPKFKTIPLRMFLSHKDIKVGARLLVLGFPLGLRSTAYANPIARQGMVARSDSDGIIADSFVFPGNSGGPVLYSPPLKFGQGLSSNLINEERLIGLISNFISYVDTAYSGQTKRPRVVFEENSGLANIVPADAVIDLIRRDDLREKDNNFELNRGTQQ